MGDQACGMPFEPSSCGTAALPLSLIFPLAQQSAGATSRLQKPEGFYDSTGTYLSMTSSPSDRKEQIVFDFEAAAVSCTAKRDSKALAADNADGQGDIVYIPMGSQVSEDDATLHLIDSGRGLETDQDRDHDHDALPVLQTNPNYLINRCLEEKEDSCLTGNDALDQKQNGFQKLIAPNSGVETTSESKDCH